jgi:protein-disulfide isomerase
MSYKGFLASLAVFLSVIALSGFYFFGQNVVNVADEEQHIANIGFDSQDEFISIGKEDGDSSPESESTTSEDVAVGGGSENSNNRVATPTQIPATPTDPPTATISATPTASQNLPVIAPILGQDTAPITLIAHLDFECAFCALFVKETLPKIKAEYIDTGKVKVEFRHYPLASHAIAPFAHNAALCANTEGKFWQYHSELFTTQSEWAGKSQSESQNHFIALAENISISQPAVFEECVKSQYYRALIESDKANGQAKQVTGTPTFFIGTQKIVGAQPFESFKALIDAQLQNSNLSE